MNNEEFVKEQMKLSKEDIIANYWYTYQDNVERLGIEHQLNLKDKEIEKLKIDYQQANEVLAEQSEEIERLNNIINKAIKYIEDEIKDGRSKDNQWLMGCYDEDKKILEILKGDTDV